tara:strand:+ start:1574 stop:1786 length:213 start_codon:yes stop_codon:yes gene_type:complete
MKKEDIELLKLRDDRNALLRGSDWVVIKALENSSTVTSAWKTYRQELRDITKTFKSMSDKDFKFPTKPTE